MKKAFAIAHKGKANTYWNNIEGWVTSLESASISDDINDTAGWTPLEGQWATIGRARVTEQWSLLGW